MSGNLNFILGLLGRDPSLPDAGDVENPLHGQAANNSRGQKVIFDAYQTNNVTGERGKWVMPQNFSGRPPVVITGIDGYVYTEFGVYAPDDTKFEHPFTIDELVKARSKADS